MQPLRKFMHIKGIKVKNRRVFMERKLFCEISPLTYQISMHKCIAVRNIKNALSKETFAKTKGEPLPIVIYRHN